MLKKVKQKLNTLTGKASGYIGVIIINLIIIVLVVGLMYLQRNWISNGEERA